MIKNVTDIDEVIDFVLELSQNELTQGYPWKKPSEKIKDCVETAISSDKENIIACYDGDKLCGVCIYHSIPDERYVQTTQFLIKDSYDDTALEFINYFKKKFAGYEFMIPLPLSNKKANDYFNKNNTELLEASVNTYLANFESHIKKHNDNIDEVTLDNFDEYAKFHDKYALPLEMFYNSKNLKKELNRFITLMYKANNKIIGVIFTKVTTTASEIIGLFIDEDYKNQDIERALVDETVLILNSKFKNIKGIIYFIEEECPDELDTALKIGFKIRSRSSTYKIRL